MRPTRQIAGFELPKALSRPTTLQQMTQAQILDGTATAKKILEQTAQRVERIKSQTGLTPALATVLVGDDPASATYVKMKAKRCEAVGMQSVKVEMPQSTTSEELLAKINELREDKAINGILLQHPVPPQCDERAAFDAIGPDKDVDGVTLASFAATSFGLPGFGCCTPAGMVRLLDEYNLPIEGKNAVVIGRSPILGKPLAMMLLERNATVVVCHSRTPKDELIHQIGRADIVCACVGKPEFVKGEWIKAGAVVLDAGYNEGNVGDAEYDACAAKASWITPVPGGVGPMTIATLIEQTSIGAARQNGVAE